MKGKKVRRRKKTLCFLVVPEDLFLGFEIDADDAAAAAIF
jgi:hypothetical protein